MKLHCRFSIAVCGGLIDTFFWQKWAQKCVVGLHVRLAVYYSPSSQKVSAILRTM